MAMHSTKSLITIEDYGTIQLRLKEVMDERGLTRNHLARLIGVRFEVVDKWYRNRLEKVDLDMLARICCVLNCSVSDILYYDPTIRRSRTIGR